MSIRILFKILRKDSVVTLTDKQGQVDRLGMQLHPFIQDAVSLGAEVPPTDFLNQSEFDQIADISIKDTI